MGAKVGKGSRGGPQADINMTPMIDIMLVLLIIFMVLQVGRQVGLSLQVPPIRSEVQTESIDQIVLEVQGDNRFLLNAELLQRDDVEGRLRQVYTGRVRKVLFVKGAETVDYGSVIHAVNAARAAGVEVVGLVPRASGL
jgi:biopolymer transport protein ExbD/biopolymer transport protein TolR